MLNVRKWFAAAPTAARKSPARRVRPGVEKLEERCTPTVYSGFARVNTATALNQRDVVTASSPNGSHVAVWTHDYTSSDTDIRAQRFSSTGAKIGGEIVVASDSRNEGSPAVCMDANGWFYVAYTRQTSSTNKDVLVSRFNSSGVFQGTTNVGITAKNEYDASIACTNGNAPVGGSFVVSYTLDYTSTDRDIVAKTYQFNGTSPLRTIDVASEGINETQSAVARNLSASNGNFSIAYTRNGGDVYLKRYNATGALLGTYAVAATTSSESAPSVAMDYAGNTVVAFQKYVGSDWDIYARKVFSNGALSTTWGVQTGLNQDTDASVAMDLTDGDFVIAYQQRGSSGPIYVSQSEVSSTGGIRRSYVVAQPTNTALSRPSVSISGRDEFFVAYSLYNGVGDPLFGAFSRRGIL